MAGKALKAMVCLAAAAAAFAAEVPSVHLVAPPSAADEAPLVQETVRAAAAELHRRYGLSLPAALTVVLTGRETLARFAPDEGRVRYDGVALTWRDTVVVDIESGSEVSLVTVLRHELFHLASEPANLPRWFDEGMAMVFSGGLFPVGEPQDERLAAPLTNVTPPVSALDLLFASYDAPMVRRAYIDSYIVARRIVERAGEEKLRRFFAERLAAPVEPFDAALKRTTGIDADAFYREVDSGRKPGGILRVLKFLWDVDVFVYLAVLLVIGWFMKRKRLKEALSRSDRYPDAGLWEE
jgi:hypothetical protein